MNVRLLQTGSHSAAMNMAIDETLLLSNPSEPILRIYKWNPPAVSIGYFQGVNEEVNVKYCKESGIDIVRRITGGGAVFHENEITYSYITRDFPQNVIESFKEICNAIISGLQTKGISPEFSHINDISWSGKKFSGNAQTRKNGTLLQHGTLLLGVDVDRMFSALRVPKEKMFDKEVKLAAHRIQPLGISDTDATDAVLTGFQRNFKAKFIQDELSINEVSYAQGLVNEKYASDEWTYRR